MKRSVFRDLLFNDITQDEFFSEYWDKKPYVFRDAEQKRLSAFFGGVDPIRRFERWLARAASDSAVLTRLIVGEHTEDLRREKAEPKIRAEANLIRTLYEAGWHGAYLVLKVDRLDEQVMAFRTRMIELLGLTEDRSHSAVGYAHFSANQGTDLHLDPTCLFQMNLSGKKVWHVATRPVDHWGDNNGSYRDAEGRIRTPTRGEDRVVDPSEFEYEEYELKPGDLIYLPARTLHSTTARSPSSISVSVFAKSATPPAIFERHMQLCQPAHWFGPIALCRVPQVRADPSSLTKFYEMAREWVESLEKNPDLLIEVLDSFQPQVREFGPWRVEAEEVTASDFYRVAPQICVFLHDRDSSGSIRSLLCGSEFLEFDSENDAQLAELLYEGGTFSVADYVAHAKTSLSEEDARAQLDHLLELGILEYVSPDAKG